MTARYQVFVSASFLFLSSVKTFDKKCANSTERSQSPNSWGWPLFPQSQNFTLQDEVIYHQIHCNSIVLEIAGTFLVTSVTILCWFRGLFCWNSSTLPTDLFICVTYARAAYSALPQKSPHITFQPMYANLLRLNITCTQHDKFTKAGNLTKTFSSKTFLETNNILAIRGTKPFLFHCMCENKRPNHVKLPYTTKQNFRIKLFPEEPFPWIMKHKIHNTWQNLMKMRCCVIYIPGGQTDACSSQKHFLPFCVLLKRFFFCFIQREISLSGEKCNHLPK